MDFQRSLNTWGAPAFEVSVQNPWSDQSWGQGNPSEAWAGHTSQCTQTRINSHKTLKIHPKPGKTHTGLQRGGTRAKPTGVCVLLGLCSGYEWAAGPLPTQPAGAQLDPSARATGPLQVLPAGTRSSHSHLLGDCCQVRNSKAEFIILADK